MLTMRSQKGVMISHRNVISNVLQIGTMESPTRSNRPGYGTEVCLGLLPLSHIYGLVVIAQASTYRGDGVIMLPKFDLASFLNAIQTYKIETLYLVSVHSIHQIRFRLILLGSSDHHSNGEEPICLLQVRS